MAISKRILRAADSPDGGQRAAKGKTATKAVNSLADDKRVQVALIVQSQRTAFEKRVWTALCEIPRGFVTTYGLLATYLGSSPRAVGNALRRNPFAPSVPCHRVVAADMRLGGFKGEWPRDAKGAKLEEKRSLLRREGVRFDGRDRVLGTPWAGWA